MSKIVTLVSSPFQPPLEVAEDIVLHLHVPYTETTVTIQVSPNVQEYQERADVQGAKIRQLTVYAPTDETKTLLFDITSNRKHQVEVEGRQYTIELMNMGKKPIQGQEFPYYEFQVTED